MIDRDRIVLPLGALAVAFLAVLLLGTVYSAFQPATVTQVLPSTPTPTPAAPGTPTSSAATTSATASTVTSDAAPSDAAPSDTAPSDAPTTPNGDGPVPAAVPLPGKVTLRLLGDDLLTVINRGLKVSVGNRAAIKVTSNPVSLPVDGPLTKLCLTTPAEVYFSIDAGTSKPVTDAQMTCFDFGQGMGKSEVDVRVTPA